MVHSLTDQEAISHAEQPDKIHIELFRYIQKTLTSWRLPGIHTERPNPNIKQQTRGAVCLLWSDYFYFSNSVISSSIFPLAIKALTLVIPPTESRDSVDIYYIHRSPQTSFCSHNTVNNRSLQYVKINNPLLKMHALWKHISCRDR